ncbi:hypothetical protein NIES19_47130 [Anabaena cylindrica PCC 7122]|nr:hypothetical protein NIES19_47130 [Anabaena cylindrica PCC 7122]
MVATVLNIRFCGEEDLFIENLQESNLPNRELTHQAL